MKIKQQILCLLCGAMLLGLLSGCGRNPPPETTVPVTTVPETTVPETTVPETTVPETTAPPTQPPHSSFYIPGVSVEDVICYFNEVCLDAEFTSSGDPSVVQKWTAPVCYILYGEYTEADLQMLHDFTSWLNTIHGFPGIYKTTVDAEANLRIHFCDQSRMVELLGEDFRYMDGGVTFWYDGENVIYDATICYRTDLDQELRNSVILEEIYNGLGPVQDTALREDSIIYAGFSQPQALTEMDELILRLLYSPQIQCGMDAEACEAIIRQLYY